MGLLFAFLENENRESNPANSAKPANFRRRADTNSQNSQLSQPPVAEREISAGREFAAFATFAAHDFENRKSPDLAPSEPPEVAVARRLDAMAAENARRRDWWTQPDPEHGSGKITMRSAATGESVTIHLPRGSAGR
jgi:hypothetical protein